MCVYSETARQVVDWRSNRPGSIILVKVKVPCIGILLVQYCEVRAIRTGGGGGIVIGPARRCDEIVRFLAILRI